MKDLHALDTRIPPPLVMALLAVLAWMGARCSPAFSFPLPFASAIAVVVAGAGVVLNVLPKLAFARARTTVNPLRPAAATHLVTSGVYRHSRNPMYLGHALILLGWGIHLHHAAGLLAVPAFVAYVSRFQVAPEERHLSARFADEYAAFCRRTPRWL
jgi:protein-S-isoprenylcysteine O-methyltransferase Ste14